MGQSEHVCHGCVCLPAHGVWPMKLCTLLHSSSFNIESISSFHLPFISPSDLMSTSQIVKTTFQPFTSPGHVLPPTLIPSLLSRFSSSAGYRLYPDVSPLLQSIRASNTSPPTASASRPWPWATTVVGVLSNSDDRVPSILSSLGLGVSSTSTTHFDPDLDMHFDPDLDMHFSVLSYDVGAEKPDRRIFEAARNLAAQMLSSSTTTAGAAGEDFLRLHVGDDLAKDTLAAQQAGWHGVLLDREGRYESAFRDGEQLATVKGGSDEGSEAVWVIRDLAHLALWRPGTAR